MRHARTPKFQLSGPTVHSYTVLGGGEGGRHDTHVRTHAHTHAHTHTHLSIYLSIYLYVCTIILKSVGTNTPNTHYLPKRDSPSPPIQCWIVLSILFWCQMMRRLKKQH